jgi:ribonuclease P protein component
MKTHETNIPTKQVATKKDYWIQSTHENCGGSQSHQPTQKSRSQKTSSLTFLKEQRLRSRAEFKRVAREGRRLVGRFLCLDVRPAEKARLGISAPVRYGSAPERNRFKRLVREAFRKVYADLPPVELNVIPRQCAKKAHCMDILNELNKLL